MIKEHYYWLDWMKAIGMYFIVAGHLEPVGLDYIYVFSVPTFFCISGFLTKKEENKVVFWNKNWHNLILPCIIISTIMYAFDIMLDAVHGRFSPKLIPYRILNCVMGVHGLNTEAGGLGNCWFIYTLVICRIFYQYTFNKKLLNFFLIATCICVAIYYNMQSETIYNSILNTSLAYPFFIIGRGGKFLYSKFQAHINNIPILIHCAFFAFFAVNILMIYIVGRANGAPWMFEAHYGKNMLLFFIGGICGTIALFIISYFMNSIRLSIIDIISRGTIVILGFQFIIIQVYYHVPKGWLGAIGDYLAAIVIILIFVPVIIFVERYIPAILGYRAVNMDEGFIHNPKK